MARQHTLGTIKDVATQVVRTTARTAGHLGGRAVEEVSTRIAARRASTPAPSTAPPASAPTEAPAQSSSRVPSPTDVAKVVARNAAGLARVPVETVRRAPRLTGPGAKLPARRGEGIVGV